MTAKEILALAQAHRSEPSLANYTALADAVRESTEDSERYRWLRRSLVQLNFSDSLIASLCRDQSELDGAMKGMA